jgi:hypothetical protein
MVAPKDIILNDIVTRAQISGSKPTLMSFNFKKELGFVENSRSLVPPVQAKHCVSAGLAVIMKPNGEGAQTPSYHNVVISRSSHMKMGFGGLRPAFNIDFTITRNTSSS